jgi:glycosyltransferase involved in cell wall biosynthesis
MKEYKVSIIIASFNNFMLLKSCLNSLENCTQGINYEVIIVDNNSDEGTVNYRFFGEFSG